MGNIKKVLQNPIAMKIKNNTQKYIIFILGLLVIAGSITFFHYKKNSIQTDLPYKQTITEEDRKPIEIPKSSLEHNRTIKIPILMYHHIGDFPKNASPTRKDLTVSTADFKQQIEWIKEKKYTSIKLENIYEYSIGKFLMPEKPVVFTFDDGYADVFDNALPILKNNGFIGSFAIITQYPKTNSGDNFYASWEQVLEAYKNGNEIVSHTQDHFDGKSKKYTNDFIAKNLSGSIEDIKQNLGFNTRILIYPYGHYTPQYIELTKKAGFVMGITVHSGDIINLDNLMEVPRVRIHGKEDFEKFKKFLP